MLMAINYRNRIEDHWSTNPFLYNPIFVKPCHNIDDN